MINEAERFFRFQNNWDLLGEENISKGFDSNHVLGFLKSQKFTELLRKYTKASKKGMAIQFYSYKHNLSMTTSVTYIKDNKHVDSFMKY